MADGDNLATKTASKTGSFVEKHKKAIYWTAGIIAAIVLYLVFRSYQSGGSANSSGGSNSSGVGTNPYAGFSNGFPGPPGPAGPEGPVGPRGPKGPRGPSPKPPHHRKPRPKVDNTPVAHHTAAQTLTASRTTHYTVKPGETSASVAAKHGMDISSLHGINGGVIGSASSVHPGQRVRVG